MPAVTKPSSKKTSDKNATAALKAAPSKTRTSIKDTPVKQMATLHPSGSSSVSEEQRRHYIEVAAYYIAERRGFHGDSTVADWAQAELEVDRMLKEGRPSS